MIFKNVLKDEKGLKTLKGDFQVFWANYFLSNLLDR